MCVFGSPKTASVTPPAEYQQAKNPDYATAEENAARRTTQQIGAAGSTILTSGQGVLGHAASDTLTANAALTGASGDGTQPKKATLG